MLRICTKVYGREVLTSQAVNDATASVLYMTADGRGLQELHRVPVCSRWIMSGTSLMRSMSFVNSIQIRTNYLYTVSRASRGIGSRSSSCDACGSYESLGHILQVCPRTK